MVWKALRVIRRDGSLTAPLRQIHSSNFTREMKDFAFVSYRQVKNVPSIPPRWLPSTVRKCPTARGRRRNTVGKLESKSICLSFASIEALECSTEGGPSREETASILKNYAGIPFKEQTCSAVEMFVLFTLDQMAFNRLRQAIGFPRPSAPPPWPLEIAKQT